MPLGPKRSEMVVQLQAMMQQLLQLEQGQMSQQRQPPPFGSNMGAAAAAAAANISSMMGQDPIDAFMQPGINSNDAFRAAIGSQLGPSHNSSSNAVAGLMGYCAHVLEERLEQVLQRAGLAGAGDAPAGVDSAAGNAASRPAATAAAAAAAASKSSSRAQQAAKGREVPFLKDQKSLPDMIRWYTQVAI